MSNDFSKWHSVRAFAVNDILTLPSGKPLARNDIFPLSTIRRFALKDIKTLPACKGLMSFAAKGL